MNIVKGDLVKLALDGEFDVIAQGCNCFNQMGKGIALTIKTIWPEAYAADCETVKGDINKLGTITYVTVNNAGKPLTLVNCYTQYRYGRNGVYADYLAIERAMLKLKQLAAGKKIGIPMIGAGLAKGDWQIIKPIIQDALADEDLTVIQLPCAVW